MNNFKPIIMTLIFVKGTILLVYGMFGTKQVTVVNYIYLTIIVITHAKNLYIVAITL